MYDIDVTAIKTLAIQRIRDHIDNQAPLIKQQIFAWIHSLYPSPRMEDYFNAQGAFPLFEVPWWLEKTLRPSIDSDFQLDLVYASMNMYYYIRLIDNVMDGDVPTDLNLLPALGVFHAEFQRPYERYFEYEHPFWEYFTAVWAHSAEVTLLDATTEDFDSTRFMDLAAQKTCAAKIPVAAVCYRYGRAELLPAWSRYCDHYGAWSQMLNDFGDWGKDALNDTKTFFLSEAGRKKQPKESISGWVIREGFQWGIDTLDTLMAGLKSQARGLNSPDLVEYLDHRTHLLLEWKAEIEDGYKQLAKLQALLD